MCGMARPGYAFARYASMSCASRWGVSARPSSSRMMLLASFGSIAPLREPALLGPHGELPEQVAFARDVSERRGEATRDPSQDGGQRVGARPAAGRFLEGGIHCLYGGTRPPGGSAYFVPAPRARRSVLGAGPERRQSHPARR